MPQATAPTARSKEELFEHFGKFAGLARDTYDPDGSADLRTLQERVFSDRGYVEPARHHADLNAAAGIPTWLYRFSYVPEALRGRWPGAPHASDVAYVFGAPELFAPRPGNALGDAASAGDRAMAQRISRYWVNFARTGDPNPQGRIDWPRHTPGSATLMDFASEGPVHRLDPFKPRLDLWQRYWQLLQ